MRAFQAVRRVAGLALCAAVAGCTTIGARSTEPGQVTYVLGALETRVESPVQEIYAAATGALQDMGLRIETSASTLVDARIVAFTAQDKRVVVEVEGLGDESSALSIRGGTFGDKDLSQRVYERILAEL